VNKIILPCFYKGKRKKVDLENDSNKKEEEVQEDEELLGVDEWEKREHQWLNNQMLYLINENYQIEPRVPVKTNKSDECLQLEINDLRNKVKINECKSEQVEREIAQSNHEIVRCNQEIVRCTQVITSCNQEIKQCDLLDAV
jgi:chromosome segregation ATPase